MKDLKRTWAAVLCAALLAALVPARPAAAAPAAAEPGFGDVAGHWAERDILAAAAAGWARGFPDGSFRPDTPVTRGEAMALIVRAMAAAGRLTRVPAGEAYLPHPLALAGLESHWTVTTGVLPTAFATGLVTVDDLAGGPHGRFAPDAPATRVTAAIWVSRAAHPALEQYLRLEHSRAGVGWSEAARQAVTVPLRSAPWPFADTVPPGGRVYVQAAAAGGLVRGFPDGRFGGGEPATRAQLVAMLRRVPAVTALAAGVAADSAVPAHPVHGPVVEVRWQVASAPARPRPLLAARPQDVPALGRLNALLAAAEPDVPPPGVGDLPVAPPSRDLLTIYYADGTRHEVHNAVRCEDYEAGRQCTTEPGWLLAGGQLVRSIPLWEYVNGQSRLDMPWQPLPEP